MNDHEITRLAAAAHELRPDWPAASVATLIRKHLADKPRRDVAVALTWIACESGTSTPARVLESGPWWRAAAVEGTSRPLNQVPPERRCSVCSLHHDRCRALWAHDHDFESAIQAKRHKADRSLEAVRRIAEATKAEVQPIREPNPPREVTPNPEGDRT